MIRSEHVTMASRRLDPNELRNRLRKESGKP
jgi:hypothetical protein